MTRASADREVFEAPLEQSELLHITEYQRPDPPGYNLMAVRSEAAPRNSLKTHTSYASTGRYNSDRTC